MFGPFTRARRAPARREPKNQSDSSGGERAAALHWSLRWAAFLSWRYRRQLAPSAVVLCLVVVSAIGHAAWPGLAWVPLLAGAALGLAIALHAHRPVHGWYAAGTGAAGLWTALAWRFGINRFALGALGVLASSASVVWLSHHLPRPRVEIVGGSRWPWRWSGWRWRRTHARRLRAVIAGWPAVAAAARVPGVTARKAIASIDDHDYVLVVDYAGYSLDDLQGRTLSRIATGLRAIRMTTRITPDDRYEHVARIVWAREDAGQRRLLVNGEEVDCGPAPAREAGRGKVAIRREQLRAVVAGIGDDAVPARELARLAGLPHAWVNSWLPRLADELGLQEAPGGWRRCGTTAAKGSGS